MRTIVFATPADARFGFDLAGVRQRVSTADELPALIADVERDPAAGVLVVDERLARGAAREALREAERNWSGVVVVLPPPGPAVSVEEDYVRRLIGAAIGYQVRVNL